MKNLIVSEILGGLGNQLFQYAIGRSLAHRLNAVFLVSTQGFSSYQLHRFSLDKLNTVLNQADISLLKSFGTHRNFKPIRNNIFYKAFYKYITTRPRKGYFVYNEKENFVFDKNIFDVKNKHIYLSGYWQSFRYFEDIKDLLKKELAPKNEPSGQNKKILDELTRGRYLALHVRRGDYITNPKANQFHGVCNLTYYQKAIRYVETNMDLNGCLIFSDDIPWCRKNLNLKLKATYIDHNGPHLAYEDLRLMQNCSAHIIANSTFSWWGAWLADERSELIIAPNQWANSYNSFDDLIPNNWIRL